MNIKGRRLKRYLGLKRKKIPFIGGVELINTGFIEGWLISENNELSEVRLIKNNHLIGRALIDVYRDDVSKMYKVSNKTGFRIDLHPSYQKDILHEGEFKIIALSVDGYKKFYLNFINSSKNINEDLSLIFKSKFLGISAQIDPVRPDGLIYGWIGSPIKCEKYLSVWVHADGLNPLEIKSDYKRKDITSYEDAFGFTIDPFSLPKEWNGKNVKITLDKGGLFDLSPNNHLVIKRIENKNNKLFSNSSINLSENIKLDFDSKIKNSPKVLKAHWESLKEFSSLMDNIESYLNNYEAYIQNRSKRQPNHFIFKINKLLNKTLL